MSADNLRDIWRRALARAASVELREYTPVHALLLGGLGVADSVHDALPELRPVSGVPQCAPVAIDDPAVNRLLENQDVFQVLNEAERLSRKFRLTEPHEELASLLLIAFARLPAELKKAFPECDVKDPLWVRQRLRACQAQLRRVPSAPRTGSIQENPSAETARLVAELAGEGIPAHDLVSGAPEPLELPSVNHNIGILLTELHRCVRRNLVLLAPAESGKTFTMHQLAARVKSGAVPAQLKGTPIIEVNLAQLTGRPDSGRTITKTFEILGRTPRAILFIDEFQGLVHQGYANSVENTAVLKNLLTSERFPNLTVIAATTRHEYELYIRVDPALERRLTPIHLQLPAAEEQREAVLVQAQRYFGNRMPLEEKLATRALHLARDYFPTRSPIGCAVELLDAAQARYVVRQGSCEPNECLTQACQDRLSTKIMVGADLESVDHVVHVLRDRVVGQPHVVHQLVESYKRTLLGPSTRGPRDVILLVGPSGVGKTHAARVYAEAIGSELVHLEMAEFSHEEDAPVRLTGAAPAYKNSEAGGVLSRAIRDKPNAVLLFDEIDQAAPPVHEFLYRVLDEGQARDGYGNPIDFRSATIFMTTNVGGSAQSPIPRIGFVEQAVTPVTELTREAVLERVGSGFPRALLSRVRLALVFQPLSPIDLADIAERRVRADGQILLERMGLRLNVRPGVGDVILLASGARQDARAIEHAVQMELWPPLVDILFQHTRGEARAIRLEPRLPGEDQVLRVLLLDDEAQAVAGALAESQPLGVHITPWADHKTAARQVAGHDLVLLDLDWGGGPEDGLRLLADIRTRNAEVPVLIYTICTDHRLRTTYFQHGATAFVPKNEPEVLRAALERTRRNLIIERLGERRFRGLNWLPPAQREDEIVVTLSPNELLE